MMLTTHQAAHLIGAQTSGADLPFLRVVTDTRLVQAGDLFVALKGDRFDAHDFVAEALAAGRSRHWCGRISPCLMPP